MNKVEAMQVLEAELELFRAKTYSELISLIDGEPTVGQRVGPSGTLYQFEVEVFWDDKPNGDIRVIGCVDDGGWRAYIPMTTGFLKSPADELVEE